jgi:hypothetical protein
MITEFWCRYLIERDSLEHLGVEAKIILKWIFKKWGVETWTGLIWLKIERVGRCL